MRKTGKMTKILAGVILGLGLLGLVNKAFFFFSFG